MSDLSEFEPFRKIPRLFRDVTVTEKIDGTNAQIVITPEGQIRAASRNRWITPADDNYGFAAWVELNKDQLLALGPGRHYGEWYGSGIQRRYGLNEKRFALFNVHRHSDARPACCEVVPVLYKGTYDPNMITACIDDLRKNGSRAAPGFMDPEGIIVYHGASGTYFKYTLDGDGHKGRGDDDERWGIVEREVDDPPKRADRDGVMREITTLGESQARNERLAELGTKIGKLVQAKNLAYGDSAGNAGAIMLILYPNGVQPHQYDDALLVVRVLDKLSRIAQRGADGKDKGGESPWADVSGYGVLGWAADIEAGRVKE